MKTTRVRLTAVATIALLACGGLAYRFAVAAPPAPEAGSGEKENLDTRYAEAQVALAEANLNRVQQLNKRQARSVSGDVVAGYQEDLAVAKLSLQMVRSSNADAAFEGWMQRARSDAASAEAQWKATAAAAKASAGAVSTSDVERLRLWYELDKLSVERGKAVANGTATQKLEWEMSLVGNEMQRMNDDLRRTATGSGAFPTGG